MPYRLARLHCYFSTPPEWALSALAARARSLYFFFASLLARSYRRTAGLLLQLRRHCLLPTHQVGDSSLALCIACNVRYLCTVSAY